MLLESAPDVVILPSPHERSVRVEGSWVSSRLQTYTQGPGEVTQAMPPHSSIPGHPFFALLSNGWDFSLLCVFLPSLIFSCPSSKCFQGSKQNPDTWVLPSSMAERKLLPWSGRKPGELLCRRTRGTPVPSSPRACKKPCPMEMSVLAFPGTQDSAADEIKVG